MHTASDTLMHVDRNCKEPLPFYNNKVVVVVLWDTCVIAHRRKAQVHIIQYAEDAQVYDHDANKHDKLMPVKHVLIFTCLHNFAHLSVANSIYVLLNRAYIYTGQHVQVLGIVFDFICDGMSGKV